MSRGGNIQGVANLQNESYLVTESLNVQFKNEKDGHKNPNNIHKYHDENHDETELDEGNSKRST